MCAAGPLLIASESASDVHGGSGLGRAVLPEPVAFPSRTPAAAAIVAAAKAHPGGVDLVATGPLTNIAAAMILEPDLPRLLKSFTLMGGAFTIAGNVTPAAEFNIWHDPEAARYVVRHFAREDVPLPVAVGLDATHQARLSEAEVEALAARMDVAPNGKALANFLRDCTAHYFDFMQERIGRRVLTLHDPLAVAAAIDPSLLTCSPFAVDVETEGKFARGLTLADRRERATPARATLAVALGVDAERFRHDFTSALERLAC